MEDALSSYRKRQQAVQKRHARLARGYVTKIDKNGLFVQVPDRKSGSVSVRLLMFAALGLLAFKTFLMIGLGAEAYGGHLATLAAGSQFEQMGAWLM